MNTPERSIVDRRALARPYAETAMLLALKGSVVAGWTEVLTRLAALVAATRRSGDESGTEATRLMQMHLEREGSHLSGEQHKFITLLIEKGRINVLPEIAEIFAGLAELHRVELPAEAAPAVAAAVLTLDNTGSLPPAPVPEVKPAVAFEFDFVDLDVPPPPVPTVINVRAALEDIQHLQKKICSIWGTGELDSFLNHLVMDARDGARDGLPMAVAAEVSYLMELNKGVRAIEFARVNSLRFEDALKVIDEGDEARHKRDVWDDPATARDEARCRRINSAVAQGPASDEGRKGQIAALIELLLLPFRNKWVIAIIAIVLTAKFFF